MATKKPLMGQGCVAVVDPGEGSGGAAPPYFWTKLRPKGPKKYWGGETGPSPLISRSGSGTVLLWWRKTKLRPEGFWGGLPPLFLDQTEAQRAKKKLGGGDWTLPPYFKVWIWHCVASVEEDSGRTFNAFSD